MTYNPKEFYIEKRLEQKRKDNIRKIKIIIGVILICLIILIMP